MNETQYTAHWYLCDRDYCMSKARGYKSNGDMKECRVMIELARISNRRYAWVYNRAR